MAADSMWGRGRGGSPAAAAEPPSLAPREPTADISVLIPVLDEQRHLPATVAAMRAQDIAGGVELLFIDGRSRDRSVEILRELQRDDPRIRVLDNPGRSIPRGLNAGLRAARGEFIARMDAHTTYPASYLRDGVRRLREGGVEWVAGPPIPTATGRWSAHAAAALRTSLGRGASNKWRADDLERGPLEWELTTSVFAGVWRRDTLDALGGWDPEWTVNEDSELASRLRAAGGRIVCRAEMGARYAPRDSLPGLWRQYRAYGHFRARTFVRHPASAGPLRVATAGLAPLLASGLLPGRAGRPSRLAATAYGGLLLAGAARGSASPREVVPLSAVLATMHVAFAAGFLEGLARSLPRRGQIRASAPAPIVRPRRPGRSGPPSAARARVHAASVAAPAAPVPDRLRIVTLLDYIVGGGAERAAIEIAVQLAKRHDVTVVSSRLRAQDLGADTFAPTVRQLGDAGVRLLALGRTRTHRVWEWRPLIREMRRTGTDVVHTHLVGSNVWGPWLAEAAGARVCIAHEQTPFARVGGLREWGLEGLVNPLVVGRLADRVLVPSRWSLRALVEHEHVPEDKIRVIPNAAPATMPQATVERASLRESIGVPDGAAMILIAAMLRPEKGHEVAVRALAEVRRRHPHAMLVLAGEGTLHDTGGTRPQLERLAAQLGAGEHVRFLGRRHDVMDLLGAADVALLSSHEENLPLAVLEYMESATPIVTTDAGGVPELVHDGAHGLVVPRGDDAAMARALTAVLDDPQAAARRGHAARERRRSEFTWEAIADDVERVYREAIAGH